MRKSLLVAVLLGAALSIPSTMALAAKKQDPAVAANRNTARFMHDATDPYCATKGKHCHRHRHHHDWGWGWGRHHHHHDWGWGWGRHHHHHWGWGWGWDQHRHGHHHKRHKKAM